LAALCKLFHPATQSPDAITSSGATREQEMTQSELTSHTRPSTAWSHWSPYILSIVRIVVALLFFEHGLSKMFGFPQPMPPPALFSLAWFSGAIEFVGGGLLALGLFSRAAAFIMSGEMAFGYFLSHAPHSFFPILNRGDAAILYCFIFLYFAFAGGGPWSLDAKLWTRRSAR
jgi:putative oxidoreductase